MALLPSSLMPLLAALAVSVATAAPLPAAGPPSPGDPFPELTADGLLWIRGKPVKLLSLDPRHRTLVVFTSVW